MNEQCKKCGWTWEKCDEQEYCADCPMNNVEINGTKNCYCVSVDLGIVKLNDECPHYVPRKESGDEDDTEM